MNLVDHPHGGVEGQAPIGRAKPLTPWGRTTFGKRTRKSDKYNNNFILHCCRKS
jgi:large subunit ribosomal protein L2